MSLDLDAVSALCPNCHIMLVEASSANSTDLSAAMATAAAKGANQISASWTIAVNGILSGAYVFPNVSTVAATGDAGYLGTTFDNYPAAFSSVTAAGGTTLAPTGGARGFSEGAWSLSGGQGGGSGCDLHVRKSTWQTDGGCSQQSSGKTFGRAYADISADADPATGLSVYDSNNGGWGVIGGTSLATPLIAAYYAITGVNGTTPQWAYTSSALLNDPTTGSSGTTCAPAIRYICNAGPGYDGPTGVGSISGAVVSGAPGIGGAPISSGNSTTYTQSTRSRGATIKGGIYPNGSDTTWWIEYGPTTSYGSQTPHVDIGSGTAPVSVTGYLSGLSPATPYHYRLVTSNSLGTTSGYDYTFTTPQSSPNDPTASFTAPSATSPTTATTFDAGTSTDSGDAIADYTWDFGDGHTVDAGPSATTSHVYTALGTYNVTLIVTSSDGHSDSVTQQVTVDNPTASFTAPQVAAPGDQASFDASASTDSLGQITDYSWGFGDGSQPVDAGTNPVTTHSFARGTYTVTLTITNSLGQQVSVSHDITSDVAPTSLFTAPTGIQATHTPLTFDGHTSTAAAGGEIVDYTWRFNDGTGPVDTGTSSVANHQYVAPGVYTVRLTVTDDLGLTGTTTQTVTVDHPTAAFAVPPTPAPGASATFDASGSQDLEGTITDYSWDFGDGTQPVDAGTDATTTHTFTARGPYTVTLTITNDSNQTDQITHTVTVDNPPTAAFSPSATLATPGSSLTFDGTGSAPGDGSMITDYSWNFGDGSQPDDTGATATDSHLYSLPGVYTVRLTVTDDLHVTNSVTQVVTIDQPSAAFTAPQTIIAPNSPASFDATGSADPGGTIADYSWDFGDGQTFDAGTSATTTHPYAARGVYHATLTIRNNSGQTDQIEHDVKVDSAPTAAFSTPAGAQTPGTPLGFDASASVAAPPDGSITTYSWTFGDGATATGVSTNHSYNVSGQYTVSLTVTDELGLSNTTTHQVTVDAPPAASFSAAPSPATVGPSVAFDGSGSSDTLGSITSYSWEFGDGATGSGPTASHPYAAPGRYTVKLKVTNDAGQTATVNHSVTVDAPPKALFSVSPTAVTTGAAVAFNASSSSDDVGTISDYAWSFGDGTRASGPTASHSYASPGTYTVGLTVTNDAGESTSTSQTVSVYSAPAASFSIAPGFAQPSAAVVFNASSSSDPGGAITAYSWSFGDGATASGPVPNSRVRQPRHLHGDADRDRKPRARDEHQPRRHDQPAAVERPNLVEQAVGQDRPQARFEGHRLHQRAGQGELRGRNARAHGQAEA